MSFTSVCIHPAIFETVKSVNLATQCDGSVLRASHSPPPACLLFISVMSSWLWISPSLHTACCAQQCGEAQASWVVVSACQSQCQGSVSSHQSESLWPASARFISPQPCVVCTLTTSGSLCGGWGRGAYSLNASEDQWNRNSLFFWAYICESVNSVCIVYAFVVVIIIIYCCGHRAYWIFGIHTVQFVWSSGRVIWLSAAVLCPFEQSQGRGGEKKEAKLWEQVKWVEPIYSACLLWPQRRVPSTSKNIHNSEHRLFQLYRQTEERDRDGGEGEKKKKRINRPRPAIYLMCSKQWRARQSVPSSPRFICAVPPHGSIPDPLPPSNFCHHIQIRPANGQLHYGQCFKSPLARCSAGGRLVSPESSAFKFDSGDCSCRW